MSQPRQFHELYDTRQASDATLSRFMSLKTFTDINTHGDNKSSTISLLTNPRAESLRAEVVSMMNKQFMIENWEYLQALYALHLENPGASKFKKELKKILEQFIEPDNNDVMQVPNAVNQSPGGSQETHAAKTTINIDSNLQGSLIKSIKAILNTDTSTLQSMMARRTTRSPYTLLIQHIDATIKEVNSLIVTNIGNSQKLIKIENFLLKADEIFALIDTLKYDNDKKILVPHPEKAKFFWQSADKRAADHEKYRKLIASCLNTNELENLMRENLNIDQLIPKFLAAEKKFLKTIDDILPKLFNYENERLGGYHAVSDTLRDFAKKERHILGVNLDTKQTTGRGNKVAPAQSTAASKPAMTANPDSNNRVFTRRK
jgi:hypothetical protein